MFARVIRAVDRAIQLHAARCFGACASDPGESNAPSLSPLHRLSSQSIAPCKNACGTLDARSNHLDWLRCNTNEEIFSAASGVASRATRADEGTHRQHCLHEGRCTDSRRIRVSWIYALECIVGQGVAVILDRLERRRCHCR